LPRFHVCSVKYGLDLHALVVDRWFYRGSMLQNGYDTKQFFSSFTSPALHSVLSPWTTTGRYLPPTSWQRFFAFIKGEKLQVPRPFPLKPKHPIVAKVMKISDPVKRVEFVRRFELAGALS